MTTRNTRTWPTALGVAIALALGSLSAGAMAQDHRKDDRGGAQHAQAGGPGPGAQGGPGRGDGRGDDGRGNDHRGNDNRGNDNRASDNRGNDNRGRPAPQYQFRDQDRAALRAHYSRNLKSVRADHRPRFERGAPIPRTYRGYITPLPASVRSRIAPPPPGYSVGYYQGYSVVYDPVTYVVLNVIDLLTR